MSHLQFHSIKMFILRLAWLNLYSEHMTTGRINQVAKKSPYHTHTHIHTETNNGSWGMGGCEKLFQSKRQSLLWCVDGFWISVFQPHTHRKERRKKRVILLFFLPFDGMWKKFQRPQLVAFLEEQRLAKKNILNSTKVKDPTIEGMVLGEANCLRCWSARG